MCRFNKGFGLKKVEGVPQSGGNGGSGGGGTGWSYGDNGDSGGNGGTNGSYNCKYVNNRVIFLTEFDKIVLR